MSQDSKLKIIPLGGLGNVTQNMFVYEYEDEMLIVDCGIGFPDSYMPGVDILVPDTSYIFTQLEAGKRIVGLVFTHGHDDHIAATPYIMPSLPEFPLYGSPLTAAFAEQRMRESQAPREVIPVPDRKEIKIGTHFSIELLHVTHSVPDTKHVVIRTPEGVIYHGSDFRLDPTPVDGRPSDMEAIAEIKKENVLCMLIDCLRVEYPKWVETEAKTGPAIEQTMAQTTGKYIMTLMSSHIHRIQHTINAAEKHKRRVVFIGRSVEQNVEIALRLGQLHIPDGMKVDKKHIETVPDNQLCIIIAGSQGQEGSSLMRAVYGEHSMVRIKQSDTVVFSADAIPGNELSYFGAINELCRNKVHVLYPDVMPDLHKSGHASAPEQQELLNLLKPKYVMPIGGDDRHRFKFFELVASKLGYDEEHVLIPDSGEIISFSNQTYHSAGVLTLKPQIVDGLGIGDVGPTVLSDRRALNAAGIVMIVIPKIDNELMLDSIQVVSRGFVFMKQADEVLTFIKSETAQLIHDLQQKGSSEEKIKNIVQKNISRKLYKIIQREPMIVASILPIAS